MQAEKYYHRAKSSWVVTRMAAQVQKINKLKDEIASLSDEQIKSRFQALRGASKLSQEIMGFGLVREAAKRVKGMEPYDVQMLGGLVLLRGMLAEMKTGEGKTLTIVAPASLLALQGKGAHVVTSNAYLAKRDAELMRPVYEALGLTVGHIDETQSIEEKKTAYLCDVTYGVGSEFGFDYLKDNLARSVAFQVQRPVYAAIVDEVDSVLIDEARVPMVISGDAQDVSSTIRTIDRCVRGLQPIQHFMMDPKEGTASLTEEGYQYVENWFVSHRLVRAKEDLYLPENLFMTRRIHSAVKAYALFKKNKDYVVENNSIMLVDTGTGRKMHGRRLEDGIHEALEAKEGVPVLRGTQTKATITYQSYFGAYPHLAGLTGTAMTEAEEFAELYNLQTVVIPTNKPVIREDLPDEVFATKMAKFQAAVNMAVSESSKGRPILLGCASVRDADILSRLLSEKECPHNTLTARDAEKEAAIIANAGLPGAVTVATNMAGRGTDILLGGEPPKAQDFTDPSQYLFEKQAWAKRREQVVASGGLFVLGTERSGIRRVDLQLAGRAGRQGDPGTVQFYLSMEDELLRVFGQSRHLSVAHRAVAGAQGALSGPVVRQIVESAQKNYEGQGFGARKSLLHFDRVLSDQRSTVYELRNAILTSSIAPFIYGVVREAVSNWLQEHLPATQMPEQWKAALAKKDLAKHFGLNVPLMSWISKEGLDSEEIHQKIIASAVEACQGHIPQEDEARLMTLQVLDDAWAEHLTVLHELKENLSLKGKLGSNPTFQFVNDAFDLFKVFEKNFKHTLASRVLPSEASAEIEARVAAQAKAVEDYQRVKDVLAHRWVSRNEACPCGSGKRFKECHGRI